MTQEEKQLLLADLCVRLPYGVMIHSFYDTYGDVLATGIDLSKELIGCIKEDKNLCFEITYGFKPYLRPMSSMTEEEKQIYWDLCYQDQDDIWGKCRFDRIVDFCLKRHLDFRGLIEKGLALEAPEGMYETKE